MNIIIAGIQGSGKGTQAAKINGVFGLHHISFGDTIKQCFTEDPELVHPYCKEMCDRGQLADDNVLFKVARKFLVNAESKYGGFILDGFPRSEGQMKFVLDNYKIDLCLKLNVPENVAIERMMARKRSDDTEQSIKNRIMQYHQKTEPIFDILKTNNILVDIDANKPIDDIFASIHTIITSILDSNA